MTEATALLAQLGAQRRHILGILDGLDDAGLRKPVLPSAWSAVGLVNHLTVDVERFWFRAVVAGEPEAIAEMSAAPGDAWRVDALTPTGDVLAGYRAEAGRADAILAGASLDAAPAWWPADAFGDWRLDTVREVVLHVLVETACHAGHLDAVRELIDGRRWMVLS